MSGPRRRAIDVGSITPAEDAAREFVRGGASRAPRETAQDAPGSTSSAGGAPDLADVERRARAKLAKSGGTPGLVNVSVRLDPKTVERLDLLARLRKAFGQTGSSKQAIIEEALAAFLPGALGELAD